jgi:hypothetical protein
MQEPNATQVQRKDLQDLTNLPRAPILSYLQKQAEPSAPRSKPVVETPSRYRLLGTFSPQQLWDWIKHYLRFRFGLRHPFQSYDLGGTDTGVYPMPEDESGIRIALAGDWGSGTDEAHSIARQILAFDPHYAIHLGDIYYVGDDSEVDENFLGIKDPVSNYAPCQWPGGRNGAFALNGNHEMYALGRAYFQKMLPALGVSREGRNQGQKASFFCLENEFWQIIGLDTGYNSVGLPLLEYLFRPDCALRPELMTWIEEVVRPGKDGRGIVLLSHHQYYSQFDDWYIRPAIQLAKLVSRPVLWFWGHEHRMAIYRPFSVAGGLTAFGRCVGHGGMPVELPPATPKHTECALEFIDARHYKNDENLQIGVNGFVQMTLQANRLDADYIDVHGAKIFSEKWVVEDGVLARLPSTW